MTHAELELTLRAQSDSRATADLRFRAPGSVADADLALGVPVALDPHALLALSSDWLAYGRVLTRQLFAEAPMREGWARVQGFAQGAGAPLRLRLRIDRGADELHALRWELLQDPATGRPLCRSERVLFARSLDSDDLAPLATPALAALRALVVVANPHDLAAYRLAPVDVPGELARARAALGDLPTTFLAGAPHGRGATLEALADALRAGYPLLALVCHGGVAAGQAALWLEREDGACDLVAADTLVERIADLDGSQRPLLVILAACQTAGRDQNGALVTALGPRLARAGVGAVIGMQGNVPMATVELLLPRLLARLREDGQIDRALALARAALPDDQPWWMPALYMRVRDGRLWAPAPDRRPPEEPQPAPPGSITGVSRQLSNPRIRGELVEFRAVFSAARGQISLLNRYKELHDALQELERPFTIVARDRRRIAADATVWEELYPQIAELQDWTSTTLGIMADPRLSDEAAWGAQQLQLAVADINLAEAHADARRLELAVGRYRRVLARELPRADNRLATCAGDLRLGQVTRVLSNVHATLVVGAPGLAVLSELAAWISTLEGLNARLGTLVPAHHRWQAVYNELNRVAESLAGDPAELELAWSDLILLTTPLFGGLVEEWAAALNALGAQINQALADGALPQARRLFISYHSRAVRRFIEVDKQLLATCNELRETGAALDLILRTLDAEKA